MNYRLAILTHGKAQTLAPTVASFNRRVTPQPTEVVIFYDGPDIPFTFSDFEREISEVKIISQMKQRGFCAATKRLWEEASRPGPEFVFWLEHDFEFEQSVDLRDLATVLSMNPQLAQVSLMRDPANQTEIDAGGLFESYPGQFEQRYERTSKEPFGDDFVIPWLEHEIYFTTTPSLMVRSFMAANPFPGYPDQCEGRFGGDLRAAGYRFGVMGKGEQWVRHTGVRQAGFGY